MLDRIAGNNINDSLVSAGLDKASTVEKADKLNAASALEATTAGLIADSPDISAEAKAKLAQENAVKPYVQKLLTQGNSPLDTARIDRFKQMVADGSITNYLNDVLPSAVDSLLASPEGKALKASLR
jgi:hypothetical protein